MQMRLVMHMLLAQILSKSDEIEAISSNINVFMFQNTVNYECVHHGGSGSSHLPRQTCLDSGAAEDLTRAKFFWDHGVNFPRG